MILIKFGIRLNVFCNKSELKKKNTLKLVFTCLFLLTILSYLIKLISHSQLHKNYFLQSNKPLIYKKIRSITRSLKTKKICHLQLKGLNFSYKRVQLCMQFHKLQLSLRIVTLVYEKIEFNVTFEIIFEKQNSVTKMVIHNVYIFVIFKFVRM